MTQKSQARRARDAATEEPRLSPDALRRIRTALEDAQRAARRAQPLVLQAQAAEAEYRRVLEEAVEDAGIPAGRRVVCLDHGIGRAQGEPCPECSKPEPKRSEPNA